MTTITEETAAQAAAEKPKTKKKAYVGEHVPAKKAKMGRKGAGAKKALKAAKMPVPLRMAVKPQPFSNC